MSHVTFWHMPRTAGTSILRGLAGMGVTSDRFPNRPARIDFLVAGHATPAQLINFGWITEAEIHESTNLICVRNPWDRLVSLFALTRASARQYGLPIWQDAGDERFPQYVDWATSPVRETARNLANHQGQPATDWIFIEGRRVPFHTIGRFEELSAYWRAVCGVFGVEGELPRTNCRAHKPYQEYYTPELRDKVAEFYAAEIEEFRYEF